LALACALRTCTSAKAQFELGSFREHGLKTVLARVKSGLPPKSHYIF
jgi:hypothetical protein